MKHGDFSTLAKHYVNRPGYSRTVLDMLHRHIAAGRPSLRIADVGAGTGKLTEDLAALGLAGFAVEPNDAMRQEGQKALAEAPFTWRAGSAESTGLESQCVDWVLMGSSFHWTEAPRALQEFRRILRPGGYFTALWNPRDLARSDLHMRIERRIHDIVPDLQRKSSGAKEHTARMEETMLADDLFTDVVFVEAAHEVRMSRERYLGAWRSVNDIQVQAGEAGFREVLSAIEEELGTLAEVVVPYRTRSWTARCGKD